MYILAANMQDVQSGIIAALRTLLLHLCEPVYKLIIFCFNIFEDFGNIRLFENSDTISGIYYRIGLILGLFMIFRISFSAIEYIINPDNILDKSKGIGNIIKRVIIVIVLLGSTRFLFDFAYDVQDRLIKSKIVPNIILGGSTIDSKMSGGETLAWYTFSTFYKINDEIPDDTNVKECSDMIEDGSSTSRVGAIYQNFVNDHTLDAAEYCLNQESANKYEIPGSSKAKNLNVIKFNGILCLGVGILLLWTIINYTIQLGVRVIQLAYLELIAPIPIMMYLTPKGEDKTMNWAKQCLTTFLDFFIRLAIMDFIILVSSALIELEDNIFGYFGSNTASNWESSYIIIIMIIALMIFAKRVPNLIQEIFPSMGGAASLGFGFGATGEAKKVGGFLGGLAGGAIGATAGGVVNAGVSAIDNLRAAGNVGRNRFGAAMHGLGSGALIGIRNGAKGGNIFKNFSAGMSARKTADRNYEQLLAEGGSARGKIASQISSHFGMTKGQEYERMRGNANRMDEFVKNIRSSVEEVDAVKKAKAAYEHFTPTAYMDEATARDRREWLFEQYRNKREEYTNAALNNDIDLKDFTDINGNKLSGNDLLNLTEARQQAAAANNFAKSVNATTIDIDGKEGKFTEIKDNETLGKVGLEANTTERMIVGSEDYIRTKANDEAAGVNKTKNS